MDCQVATRTTKSLVGAHTDLDEEVAGWAATT